MKHLHLSRKNILLFSAFIIILFVLSLAVYNLLHKNNNQDIYYFYDEVCSSCDKNGEFIELFNQKLSDVKEQATYQLITSNTFEDGEEKWKQLCKKLNIPIEKKNLPMVIIGNQYASGDESIAQTLRTLFCKNFNITDTKTLWYYYRPTCKDCVRIEPLLKEKLFMNPEFSVISIDTTQAAPKEEFKQNLDKWGVPNEEWQVPFLYNGRDYLSGDVEIELKLHEFLEKSLEEEGQ